MLLAVALLYALGVGAGCDDRADGYEPFEGGGASVLYPASFEDDRSGAPGPIKELLNLRGPEDEEGLEVRISLIRGSKGFGFDETAREFGKQITIDRPSEFIGGRIVAAGETTVPGAADGGAGYRILTRHKLETNAFDLFDARQTDIVAFGREDASYVLSVGGPTAALEQIDTRKILRSLRID